MWPCNLTLPWRTMIRRFYLASCIGSHDGTGMPVAPKLNLAWSAWRATCLFIMLCINSITLLLLLLGNLHYSLHM